MDSVRPCDIALVALEVEEEPGDSLSIALIIEVRNPNAVPVEVVRFDADITAEDERLLSVTILGPLRVAAGADALLRRIIELPVTEVNAEALLTARSSSADMGVEGRLYIAVDGREYSFRVSSFA